MTSYLIDTDVLIDVLRGARRLELPVGSDGACSVLTRAELLAGRGAVDQPIAQLLASLVEIPVDTDIATRAGTVRRQHGIGLADAVIAATALVTRRTVLTRNRRHFEPVEGLAVESP